MQYSFPGESHTLAFLFVIFDGSEGFIVQGGKKDPLPGQKLKVFIPMETSKISVRKRPHMTWKMCNDSEESIALL